MTGEGDNHGYNMLDQSVIDRIAAAFAADWERESILNRRVSDLFVDAGIKFIAPDLL